MIDKNTLEACKNDIDVLNLKIKNTTHAISQAENLLSQSNLDENSLIFIRKKIAESNQDLEFLYIIKSKFF